MDKVYLCECNGKEWLIHGRRIECTTCGRQYGHLTDGYINQWQSETRAATPKEFNEDRDHWKHDGDWINDEWVPVKVRNVITETDDDGTEFVVDKDDRLDRDNRGIQ